MSGDGLSVIHRYVRAMNEHDLEALIDCFDPDYRMSSR
jgi:hypothetical protein